MNDIINSTLAAKFSLHQDKQLSVADGLADTVDSKLQAILNRMVRVLRSKAGPTEKKYAIRADLYKVVLITNEIMARGLAHMASSSHDDASTVLVKTIPRGHLSLITERKPVLEGRKEEMQAEIKDMVFDPLSTEKIQSIVRGTTAGASWQSRLAQQTSLAPPEHLATILTQDFNGQKTPAELARVLKDHVGGVASTARRVARNESMRIAHESRMDAYDDLGDLVIGFQIHATMDSRVRPEHAARSGTIYYKKPTADQLGLDKMPRPPIEEDGTVAHNCRCWITPVLSASEKVESDPASKALFTDNAGKLIPNPTVYTDWFDRASEADKARVVGPKRLKVMRDQLLPGEKLNWGHFVNPKTGKLIDAIHLEYETINGRQNRLKKFTDLIAKRKELTQKVYTYGYLPPEKPPEVEKIIAPVVPPPEKPPEVAPNIGDIIAQAEVYMIQIIKDGEFIWSDAVRRTGEKFPEISYEELKLINNRAVAKIGIENEKQRDLDKMDWIRQRYEDGVTREMYARYSIRFSASEPEKYEELRKRVLAEINSVSREIHWEPVVVSHQEDEIKKVHSIIDQGSAAALPKAGQREAIPFSSVLYAGQVRSGVPILLKFESKTNSGFVNGMYKLIDDIDHENEYARQDSHRATLAAFGNIVSVNSHNGPSGSQPFFAGNYADVGVKHAYEMHQAIQQTDFVKRVRASVKDKLSKFEGDKAKLSAHVADLVGGKKVLAELKKDAIKDARSEGNLIDIDKNSDEKIMALIWVRHDMLADDLEREQFDDGTIHSIARMPGLGKKFFKSFGGQNGLDGLKKKIKSIDKKYEDKKVTLLVRNPANPKELIDPGIPKLVLTKEALKAANEDVIAAVIKQVHPGRKDNAGLITPVVVQGNKALCDQFFMFESRWKDEDKAKYKAMKEMYDPKATEEACQKGADWLSQLVGGGKVDVPLSFMDDKASMTKKPEPVERAFQRDGSGVFINPCMIPPKEDSKNILIVKAADEWRDAKKEQVTSVFIHETGHHIETDPEISKMVDLFKAYRCGTEKPKQFNKMPLFAGYNYKDTEEGVDDDFGRAFSATSAYYVGKDYGRGASEILSMGLQKLYDDPKNFLEKDPEYAQFCINMVAHYKNKKEKERI
jgi:SPP1 gp7 family putative phage head morphogenesis protein